MRTVLVRGGVALTAGAAVGTLVLAGCAGGDAASEPGADVVVTTSILGDVVENLVGAAVEVEVVMPPNADPHDFAPSARQAASLRAADVVVANGLGLEAPLDEALAAAEADGATVLRATDYVETVPFGAHPSLEPVRAGLPGDAATPDAEAETGEQDRTGGDEHGHGTDARADAGHADGDEADHADGEDPHEPGGSAEDDHHGHDHEGDDPHIVTDPVRMAAVVEGLSADLAGAVPGLDVAQLEARAGAYVDKLRTLHHEVGELFAGIPQQRRRLVTNHEVLGYFADRYDLQLVGVVIPGGTTLAEPSAAALARLADEIEATGTPALFVEASARHVAAEAVAAEAGVDVVELYTEALGEPGSGADTYLGLIEANARRVAAVLSP